MQSRSGLATHNGGVSVSCFRSELDHIERGKFVALDYPARRDPSRRTVGDGLHVGLAKPFCH